MNRAVRYTENLGFQKSGVLGFEEHCTSQPLQPSDLTPLLKPSAIGLPRGGGKEKMVIIGAAMRKLLHICYGVLKNQTPFDASLHPGT